MAVKIRRLLLFVLACSAVLQACGESSCSVATSTTECPDLTGTYEVRVPAWVNTLFLVGGHPKMQSTQFATFLRRDNSFTLIWHTSRQDFLATARSLAQRDPNKYDIWLDMMLRDPKLPRPLGVPDEQTWLWRISNVGPIFRWVDEALPLKQCKQGWFLLVGPGHRKGPPDFEGGMDGSRELEIWLGRDEDGSLLMKTVEYKTLAVLTETRATGYYGIRLWSSTHLSKWPAAPVQDLTPIRAEELPPRNRPPRRFPKCQITDDHEAVFFQRLKAHLPPKVQIENRSSSIIHGRMRPDGSCDPTPYTVTVSVPDEASIAQVADYLRTDPFIRRVDSQEPIGNGGLLVKFRMMAAPWEIESGTPGEPPTILNTQ